MSLEFECNLFFINPKKLLITFKYQIIFISGLPKYLEKPGIFNKNP